MYAVKTVCIIKTIGTIMINAILSKICHSIVINVSTFHIIGIIHSEVNLNFPIAYKL